MKCTNCDGTGKVVHPMMSMNGDDYTGEWEQHECEACNGTGEVEMTEQEYIQTCTTEQLAEFLAGILNTNPCGYLLSCNECGLNDRCREDDYPSSKEAWGEWLKQPHTPIS